MIGPSEALVLVAIVLVVVIGIRRAGRQDDAPVAHLGGWRLAALRLLVITAWAFVLFGVVDAVVTRPSIAAKLFVVAWYGVLGGACLTRVMRFWARRDPAAPPVA